ncbi:putative ORFan [Tupanvirus deep ocean]|uniref:ORFan n=2 Tax=Tupanvirus TaxID=2094720 RepID=A0AC62A7R1_9VIRU|nr:putative ORFan [Tupanvirus deep ocean]QKU33821.1 putative ORFan [Tupanvirus deep ocean]
MTEKQSTQPLSNTYSRPTGLKQPVKRQTIFLSVEETMTLARRDSGVNTTTTTTTKKKVVVQKLTLTNRNKKSPFRAKKFTMRKKYHCHCGFEQKRFKTPNGNWLVVCSRTNETIDKCL